MKPWRVLSSKPVFKDKFLSLRTDRCQREDGHIVPTYHVLEFTDWVTVVPLTSSGNIILVNEYRHAAGVVTTGLPGGVAEPHETDWAEAGARELREETGFVPREMHQLGICFPNPATQNNRIHYYLALDCAQSSTQALDANEDVEVIEMPLKDFLSYDTFEIQHALHAAALFYLVRFFEKHPHLKP